MKFKNRGKFICIEGLEGAGKTSVIDSVVNFLKINGIDAIKTNEPCSDDEICGQIRNILKVKTNVEIVKTAECLLFYASRAQSIATKVIPALEDGKYVVVDRHDWSTISYQCFGGGVAMESLEMLRTFSIGNLKPDFTIYLDVDPAVGINRARERGALDRIEEKDLSFFVRAREGYKTLVSENPSSSVMIDGHQSKDDVAASVILAVKKQFNL